MKKKIVPFKVKVIDRQVFDDGQGGQAVTLLLECGCELRYSGTQAPKRNWYRCTCQRANYVGRRAAKDQAERSLLSKRKRAQLEREIEEEEERFYGQSQEVSVEGYRTADAARSQART